MDDEEINKIYWRVMKTTPGPWKERTYFTPWGRLIAILRPQSDDYNEAPVASVLPGSLDVAENVEFFINARPDILKLIEVVRAEKEEVKRLKDVLDKRNNEFHMMKATQANYKRERDYYQAETAILRSDNTQLVKRLDEKYNEVYDFHERLDVNRRLCEAFDKLTTMTFDSSHTAEDVDAAAAAVRDAHERWKEARKK